MSETRRLDVDFPFLGDEGCDALAAAIESAKWPGLYRYSVQPWQLGRHIAVVIYVRVSPGRVAKMETLAPRTDHPEIVAELLKQAVDRGVSKLVDEVVN